MAFALRIVHRDTDETLVSGDEIPTAAQVGRALVDALTVLTVRDGHDPDELRPQFIYMNEDGSSRMLTEAEFQTMINAMRQHGEDEIVKPMVDRFDDDFGTPDTLH